MNGIVGVIRLLPHKTVYLIHLKGTVVQMGRSPLPEDTPCPTSVSFVDWYRSGGISYETRSRILS